MSTKDYLEKDFYKVLGVAKDAPADEIKKSYRKLARKHHPDTNKGDSGSEDRFKEISEAYDVLSDDTKRREYDEARALFGSGGMRFGTGGGAGGGMPGAGAGATSFDLSDLFGNAGAGGGLGDVLGGFFGNRRPGGPSPQAARRGSDIESEVTLSFHEAVDGVTMPLRLTSEDVCSGCRGTGAKAGTSPRVCPACQGTGQTSRNAGGFAFAEPCRDCRGRGLIVDDPCPVCGGSGRGQSTRTISARIPAGVRDRQRIRLKGKGTAGERGGPSGDLFILVHVTPHPLFGRKGDNITLTVPISYPEAALGAEVKVPTLDGQSVTLRIPAGTSNGRTFRVRGKGGARKDGTRGDQLVTVEVAVPQRLSDEARAALEAYRAATSTDDPRAGLSASGSA